MKKKGMEKVRNDRKNKKTMMTPKKTRNGDEGDKERKQA